MTEAMLQEYLQRPFSLTAALTDDGEWRAEVPELPGCVAFGASRDEALSRLETARAVWLETALENGLAIPDPRVVREVPSGRVTLRIPRDLHARLAALAETEGVSLNQIMLYLLSRGVGEVQHAEPRSSSSVADRTASSAYRP